MSLAEAARLEAIAISLEQEARQLRALAQEFRDASTASNDGNSDGGTTKMSAHLNLADSAPTTQPLSKNSHGLRDVSTSASTIERLPEAENHLESPTKVQPELPAETNKRSEPVDVIATSSEKSHERPPKRRVTVSRASENVDDKGPAPTGKARKDVSFAGASEENVNDSTKSKPGSSGKVSDGSAAASSSALPHWACEACTLENSGPATKCACCGTVRKALSERPSRMSSPQQREEKKPSPKTENKTPAARTSNARSARSRSSTVGGALLAEKQSFFSPRK